MPNTASGPQPAKKQVKVTFPTQGGPELHFANGVVVNFTGTEFLITFFQAIPPPFVEMSEIPDEIEGRVIYRVAMNPERWAETVQSFSKQISDLRKQGLLFETEDREEE